MTKKTRSPKKNASVFSETGMKPFLLSLYEEIQELYLGDAVPWVIGYSGGKDSTAILQLVWNAIREIPIRKRQKKIYVISTDTRVEQPVVAHWVEQSHQRMLLAAKEQNMPIVPKKLEPEISDSFWVNLIGKGYPAPRKMFRWCTSRLKINPSNNFVRSMVRDNGEVLLVLGTRKAESQRRARTMEKHGAKSVRERLTPNASLPNSLVYTPIEDWSNDDVWLYLMQVTNPWKHTNKALLGMYQGATASGECPLVLDTSSPSCGDSRFGCWVCTLVDRDRSMEAMIKNDEEKTWLEPLLDLRNDLGNFSLDPERRDYRRMSGRVQLFHDSVVRGPYTKETREYWLQRVLEVEKQVQSHAPSGFQNYNILSYEELCEIRKIWLYEKREFDDSLPGIYQNVTGKIFLYPPSDDTLLQAEDWEMLKEICGNNRELFYLQTRLLDVERAHQGMSRRAGILDALETQFRIGQFNNEREAVETRQKEAKRLGKNS